MVTYLGQCQHIMSTEILDITVVIKGLPRWLSGKESTCQCRRYRFHPWVVKVPWSRKWQPASGFLPGKFHGQRSLAGYSSCGHRELDTTE